VPDRPSNKEICKKVADALAAVEAGRRQIALTKHFADDVYELGLEGEAALWELIPKLLREIQEADPAVCYAGSHPPLKSYEREILGAELWAFHWKSSELAREMYLKFVMKKGTGDWVYAHCRCHDDRP